MKFETKKVDFRLDFGCKKILKFIINRKIVYDIRRRDLSIYFLDKKLIIVIIKYVN